METVVYGNWENEVVFSPDGPQHKLIIGSEAYRAVLVGLNSGQSIPAHPSTAAAYHFLQGEGWMNVGEERVVVKAGMTVAVGDGVPRGVEAETRLAFLGSHGARKGVGSPNLPIWMLAIMGFFLLLTMVSLIAIGANPMAMMVSGVGNLGLGVLGSIVLPLVGLVGMLVIMVHMFRRMTVVSGMMHEHRQHMPKNSVDSAKRESDEFKTSPGSAVRISYNIPGINCSGCKHRIEGAVGAISGVESVEVDVDSKQAILSYRDPAASSEVEAVLAEIGYPATKG